MAGVTSHLHTDGSGNGGEAEPAHDAAVDGDTERVERLLDEGADDAGTALRWALFAT